MEILIITIALLYAGLIAYLIRHIIKKKKLNSQKKERLLIVNAIATPDGTILRSTSFGDFQEHRDTITNKLYFVDGGLWHPRRSNNGDEVILYVYDDVSHENQRHILKWGTFGKDGTKPLAYKTIASMSNDHIKNVLKNCVPHIQPQLKNCMVNELAYRKQNHMFVMD